jgi:N-acetylglucosaminyl-diphospho-decaprenol L-rhamnosyltransferase
MLPEPLWKSGSTFNVLKVSCVHPLHVRYHTIGGGEVLGTDTGPGKGHHGSQKLRDGSAFLVNGSRPTVYIPHLGEPERLLRCLASLHGDTLAADIVVVENGATGQTEEALGEWFPKTHLIALKENLGFGRALNLAVKSRGGDPVIFLNNDVECQPGFLPELIAASEKTSSEMLAAVLVQKRRRDLIDSAGVIADRTLMGFDYLHGEPITMAMIAADPLGPTGGAALYRRDAFEEVGGFDERIFLYYEDLDLALRIHEQGGRCRLVPQAVGVHECAATLGARNPGKYALTGWSRGYMLRRYSVMRSPSRALRVMLTEGAICAGQVLNERTTRGLSGRLRGWKMAGGLSSKGKISTDAYAEISFREALARRHRRYILQ